MEIINDIMKTNIRVSQDMKHKLQALAEGSDIANTLTFLLEEYNAEWEKHTEDEMILMSIKFKTDRKSKYDKFNESLLAKDDVITYKGDAKTHKTFKHHCDTIGITFAEGVRRVVNQAYDRYEKVLQAQQIGAN